MFVEVTKEKLESESEHFCEKIRKKTVDTCADKVVEGTKNKKKLTLNHTKEV